MLFIIFIPFLSVYIVVDQGVWSMYIVLLDGAPCAFAESEQVVLEFVMDFMELGVVTLEWSLKEEFGAPGRSLEL